MSGGWVGWLVTSSYKAQTILCYHYQLNKNKDLLSIPTQYWGTVWETFGRDHPILFKYMNTNLQLYSVTQRIML